MFQLSQIGPLPKGMSGTEAESFKLNQSTPSGRRADEITQNGPQFQTLNSVVDHTSILVLLSVLQQMIEAVCDSGASVSCQGSKVFNKFKKVEKLQLKPSTTKPIAANKQPIATPGTVCFTSKIGLKEYVQVSHVLEESEADCLIGLEFLRANKCDPLISKDHLQLDDNTQVPLYHCKNDVESSSVFRVVATETVSVPAGYTMAVPAQITDWKRPLEEMDALCEPSSRFDETKDATAPCIVQFGGRNYFGPNSDLRR